jgi:hypothetical protein
MSWKDEKSNGQVIDADEWTEMANTLEYVSGNYLSSNALINRIGDVDTSSTPPSRDQVLKWNGNNWVPSAYDETFEFTIASFNDNESSTQLIGTGVWKLSGAMTFSVSYNNGPPDNSCIQLAENDSNYDTLVDTLTSPFTDGTNNSDISYPTGKDQYIRFRVSANSSTDTDTQSDSAIYFRNYIRWGVLGKNSSFTGADVSGLSSKTISNDNTRSESVNSGIGEYIVFAHPASYSDIPTGDDYENDGGGTGFRFKGMTCSFETKETVSVTNGNGFTENYDVYGSTLSNLGNSTLYTYTSRQELNKIYYGVTSKTSGYTETDIESLSQSEITDDSTQVWNEVSPGVGEYLLFCFPKRWGEKGTDYTFYDNSTGFQAAFEDAETVSVTNQNSWTEDFYVYRSENSNLGNIVIETK